MNQLLAVTAGLALTIALWVLGKKPLKSIPSIDSKDFASTSNLPGYALIDTVRAQISSKNPSFGTAKTDCWQVPTTPRERLHLLTQLRNSMSGGPEERFKAISLASIWGHPSALPILRRGLKDSDIKIVGAAAAAIQSHKGRGNLIKSQETRRPPRNVALMR